MASNLHHEFGATDPIQDYKVELERYTIQTAICRRPYVCVSKLIEWWKSGTTIGENPTTQATRLLEYTHRERRNNNHPYSMNRDRLLDKNRPYILIFSILLEMGWGDLIDLFPILGLSDHLLPFDKSALESYFKRMAASFSRTRDIQHPESLSSDFFQKQWRFCPHIFNLADFHDLQEDHIVPIHRIETISEKGGTATLWQIEILKEFVGAKLQEAARASEYTPVNGRSDELGPRYQFALKKYNAARGEETCRNERNAFEALRGHGGMIQYFGAYCQRPVEKLDPKSPSSHHADSGRKKIYHIILEYGNRDLDELFIYKLPPVLPNEIEGFWYSLFEIAEAVKHIHNLTISNDGYHKHYDGWHADIKPDNILDIGEKFKLADLGFAKFLEKSVEKRGSIPTTTMRGGTSSFGAPELHPGRKESGEADQTIDIWSLGCVFSVAATWVALDLQGTQHFMKWREQAISKRVNQQKRLPDFSTTTSPKLDHGDYFHDGLSVLPEVKKWHNHIRQSLRRTDRITGLVIDLVDNHMLVGNPAERIDSSKLCKHLEEIHSSLEQSTLESMVDPTITSFLKEQEAEIPEAITSTSWEAMPPRNTPSHRTFKDRQDQKSRHRNAPRMPTTHRSQARTSLAPIPNSRRRALELESTFIEEEPTRMTMTDLPETASVIQDSQSVIFQEPEDMFSRNALSADDTSISARPHRFSSIGSSNVQQHTEPCVFENVEQAREAIEKRKRKGPFSFLKSKTPKDELLARYYKNRDIKFLVDNAATMRQHWSSLKRLLETLLMKVEGLDDDGVDLAFTQGTENAKNVKGRSKIMRKMDALDTMPMEGVPTEMVKPLEAIFNEYKRKVDLNLRQNRENKDMILIVLTDGIWDDTNDKNDVGRAIVSFIQELRSTIKQDYAYRMVGIQFVQFGNDQRATELLRFLDNDLEGIPDVVDTESATGNVNKMLLGSFVKRYDAEASLDSTTSISSPTSPGLRDSLSFVEKGASSRQGTYGLREPSIPMNSDYFSTSSPSPGSVPQRRQTAHVSNQPVTNRESDVPGGFGKSKSFKHPNNF